MLGCAGARGARSQASSTRRRTIRTLARTRWAVPAALLALVLAGCGARGGDGAGGAPADSAAAGGGLFGVELPNPGPKPDFTLTDTDGRRFDFRRETDGHLTLLFFGYTKCPDICPVHMANIAAALDRLPRADAERVRVVFVTTDPTRDTPRRMREWLAAFDPSFVGLTGTPAELMDAQIAAGVAPSVAKPAPGDTTYEVGHAAQVLAYTPDDRLRAQYPFGTRQREWAHDLPLLLALGGPDLRLEAGYARVTPTRDGGAGYFRVINRGALADTLLGVTVRGGADAQLHTMRADGSGMIRMVPLGTPALAPGETLRLAEGGHHLMFDLPAGSPAARADSLDVTLRFARSGARALRLPVRAYGEEAGE